MSKQPLWIHYCQITIKTLIFLASCYFIYNVVSKNLITLQAFPIPNWRTLLLIFLLTVLVYIVLMMCMALAWILLLNYRQAQEISRIYFSSQILKYLPGNVFHFAYRHSQSKQLGMTHKQLIKASIYETIVLITAALLICNTLFLSPENIPWFSNWTTEYLVLIVMAEIIVLGLINNRVKNKLKYLILSCYIIYFLGMGSIAYALTSAFNTEGITFIFITGCYAVSWMAGYIIPGAPGGLGVREAIFILITSTQLSESEALIIITIIRLISIIAESLLYLTANNLSRFLHHCVVWFDRKEL